MIKSIITEPSQEDEKEPFIGGEVLTRDMLGVVKLGKRTFLAFIFTVIYMVTHIIIHHIYDPNIIVHILLFNIFYASMLFIIWRLWK